MKEKVINNCNTIPIKIVFISDLHVGQFYGHEKKFELLINKINDQKPDIILLGGDMICCFAEEIKPLLPSLKKLKAKGGVFAIHGNHDYGDYFWWKNSKEKMWNHQLLEYFYKQAGIKVLNNEHIYISDSHIILAGIGNCGHPPYGCHADWSKTFNAIPDSSLVVLIAHDPWNWDRVKSEYPQVKLTLSGHTHAYQFGIDTKRFCWSPFRPKKPFCGLYQHGNQYLYISRGIGSAMFASRIGMWPEITVITLN
ncbi:MAG: metallophosphoesterase [Bacteroidales bacterium]|nr:metallophosphoesterase [Bacteroidales bacterium]